MAATCGSQSNSGLPHLPGLTVPACSALRGTHAALANGHGTFADGRQSRWRPDDGADRDDAGAEPRQAASAGHAAPQAQSIARFDSPFAAQAGGRPEGATCHQDRTRRWLCLCNSRRTKPLGGLAQHRHRCTDRREAQTCGPACARSWATFGLMSNSYLAALLIFTRTGESYRLLTAMT